MLWPKREKAKVNPRDSWKDFMKNRTCRRIIAFVIIGLLLAWILSYAILSTFRSKLYCSPSQPRPSGMKTWEAATGPAQPPEEPNENFFSNFTVSSNEENFLIEHTLGNPPDNPFNYEVRKMTPGKPLDIGSGTLTLCVLGTAYHDANQTMEDDAAYRFYDAELQRMPLEQVKKFKINQSEVPGSNFRYTPFPRFRIGFNHEGIDDLMFQGIRVFDTSTKKELTGGYSSRGQQKFHSFDTSIPLWHRTPIHIFIEVSYGPSKTFEFAPRTGEGFKEGNFECRLIQVFENVDIYSSSSSSRKNTMTYEFRKVQADKAGLRFVFACQPTASKMPVTFDFLDPEGNILSGRGSSTSGFVCHHSVKQPLEKVARIRARYRTLRQRIVIHLPYIPGLPEKNDAIEDLFDVHIPYVRLYDASQVGSFLRQTLQLQSGRQTGPAPPNSINSIRFPVEFRDTNVREIARFYAEGGNLEVDIERERLFLEYPLPLMTRLKLFLQKMLRRK